MLNRRIITLIPHLSSAFMHCLLVWLLCCFDLNRGPNASAHISTCMNKRGVEEAEKVLFGQWVIIFKDLKIF